MDMKRAKLQALTLIEQPKQRVLVDLYFDFLDGLEQAGFDVSGLHYKQDGLQHHNFVVPNDLWGEATLWIAEGQYRRAGISFHSSYGSQYNFETGKFDSLKSPITISSEDTTIENHRYYKIFYDWNGQGTALQEPTSPGQLGKMFACGFEEALRRRSRCKYTKFAKRERVFSNLRLIRPEYDRFDIVSHASKAIHDVWQYEPEVVNRNEIALRLGKISIRKPGLSLGRDPKLLALAAPARDGMNDDARTYTALSEAFVDRVAQLSDPEMRSLGEQAQTRWLNLHAPLMLKGRMGFGLYGFRIGSPLCERYSTQEMSCRILMTHPIRIC